MITTTRPMIIRRMTIPIWLSFPSPSPMKDTFLQADLSSIEDLDENNVIYDLIKTDSVSWIGGRRDTTNWGWSDGLAWNWENWHTGEPNNAGGKWLTRSTFREGTAISYILHFIGNEYCVCMNYHKDGSWNDCDCDMLYGGVCKQRHLPDLTGF